MTNENELLTPQQAAKYLKVSLATIYRYLNDQREDHLPHYNLSPKSIRIRKSDLDKWVLQHNSLSLEKINTPEGGEH